MAVGIENARMGGRRQAARVDQSRRRRVHRTVSGSGLVAGGGAGWNGSNEESSKLKVQKEKMFYWLDWLNE